MISERSQTVTLKKS